MVRFAPAGKLSPRSVISIVNGYNGHLPMEPGGGVWLWDIPITMRDDLVNLGAAQDICYCPTAEDRDVAGLWDFNPTYAVFGYFVMTQRHPWVPNPPPAAQAANWPNLPLALANCEYYNTLATLDAADKVLASDAQLEQNGDFYNVIGGFKVIADHSNHIKGSNYKPYGGNIVFLDGHGEWRDFSGMQNRAASGNVNFWF